MPVLLQRSEQILHLHFTNETVKGHFRPHSPSQEASAFQLWLHSSWFQPPPSLEIKKKKEKQTVTPFCQNMLQSFPHSSPSPLRSCNVNRLRALQEVVCLLIGQIPAVCRSVLSSGRPCGSAEEREREREMWRNAGQRLSRYGSSTASGTSSTDQRRLLDIFTAWLPP